VLNYGDGSPALELGAFTAPATTSHEYMRLGAYTARLDATTVSGETRSATSAPASTTRRFHVFHPIDVVAARR